MRILITGGSGLIGRALASDLSFDGHEVIVLSRSPEKKMGVIPGVQSVKWDGVSADGWFQFANGSDAIVNLAGANIASGRWTALRKRELVKSRLDAGRAVTQAIELVNRKPCVIVQASAVGYYGPSGEELLTEESPEGEGFLAQLAAKWEQSTKDVERLGVRRVVIRTGVVLSTKGGALPKMMAPFRYFAGGTLGNGRQWVPWIHIKDEVRAIRFLIEKETIQGPFNLTSPNPITNREFARIIGLQLRRPSFMAIPAFLLKSMLGEMAAVVLDGQRVFPSRLVEAGFTFSYPEADIALNNLLV